MIDQKVEYKTIILARSKGYDPIDLCNCTEFPECICPCDLVYKPTQSLLQKWIRDIHNIHIIIEILANSSWTYTLSKTNKRQVAEVDTDFTWTYHKSYELALESGITEALNYIDLLETTES